MNETDAAHRSSFERRACAWARRLLTAAAMRDSGRCLSVLVFDEHGAPVHAAGIAVDDAERIEPSIRLTTEAMLDCTEPPGPA